MPPGYQPPLEGGVAPLAGGVPWESREGGFLSRWWDTFKAVNFETRPFFSAAAQSDDGITACIYSTIGGALGGVAIGLLYFVLLVAVYSGLGMLAGSGKVGASLAGVGIGVGLLYAMLFTFAGAAGGFIGPWINGGIHHLLLMLYKGVHPQREYSHTVRAYAYGYFSALPFLWIPILGLIVVPVLAIKNLIQGYSETHQASVGKVVLALATPLICCCLCYLAYGLLVGSLVMLSRP